MVMGLDINCHCKLLTRVPVLAFFFYEILMISSGGGSKKKLGGTGDISQENFEKVL